MAGLFDGLVGAGQHQLRNIKAKLVVPMVDVDYVDPIAHSPLAATNSWERIDGREHRRCGGWRARTLTQIIAVTGSARRVFCYQTRPGLGRGIVLMAMTRKTALSSKVKNTSML